MSTVVGTDFTGTWVTARVEGEINEYMTAAGVGMIQRNLAAVGNYGVGRARQKIAMAADRLSCTIEVTGGWSDRTFSLTMDGSEQEVPGGFPGRPKWDGEGALVITTDEPPSVMRRTLSSAGEMVVVLSCGGHQATRYFTKEE